MTEKQKKWLIGEARELWRYSSTITEEERNILARMNETSLFYNDVQTLFKMFVNLKTWRMTDSPEMKKQWEDKVKEIATRVKI